jgi:hypothetical protein
MPDSVKLVYYDEDTNIAVFVGKAADTAVFLLLDCPYAATSSYREIDGDRKYYEYDGVSAWYEQ